MSKASELKDAQKKKLTTSILNFKTKETQGITKPLPAIYNDSAFMLC